MSWELGSLSRSGLSKEEVVTRSALQPHSKSGPLQLCSYEPRPLKPLTLTLSLSHLAVSPSSAPSSPPPTRTSSPAKNCDNGTKLGYCL